MCVGCKNNSLYSLCGKELTQYDRDLEQYGDFRLDICEELGGKICDCLESNNLADETDDTVAIVLRETGLPETWRVYGAGNFIREKLRDIIYNILQDAKLSGVITMARDGSWNWDWLAKIEDLDPSEEQLFPSLTALIPSTQATFDPITSLSPPDLPSPTGDQFASLDLGQSWSFSQLPPLGHEYGTRASDWTYNPQGTTHDLGDGARLEPTTPPQTEKQPKGLSSSVWNSSPPLEPIIEAEPAIGKPKPFTPMPPQSAFAPSLNQEKSLPGLPSIGKQNSNTTPTSSQSTFAPSLKQEKCLPEFPATGKQESISTPTPSQSTFTPAFKQEKKLLPEFHVKPSIPLNTSYAPFYPREDAYLAKNHTTPNPAQLIPSIGSLPVPQALSDWAALGTSSATKDQLFAWSIYLDALKAKMSIEIAQIDMFGR